MWSAQQSEFGFMPASTMTRESAWSPQPVKRSLDYQWGDTMLAKSGWDEAEEVCGSGSCGGSCSGGGCSGGCGGSCAECGSCAEGAQKAPPKAMGAAASAGPGRQLRLVGGGGGSNLGPQGWGGEPGGGDWLGAVRGSGRPETRIGHERTGLVEPETGQGEPGMGDHSGIAIGSPWVGGDLWRLPGRGRLVELDWNDETRRSSDTVAEPWPTREVDCSKCDALLAACVACLLGVPKTSPHAAWHQRQCELGPCAQYERCKASLPPAARAKCKTISPPPRWEEWQKRQCASHKCVAPKPCFPECVSAWERLCLLDCLAERKGGGWADARHEALLDYIACCAGGIKRLEAELAALRAKRAADQKKLACLIACEQTEGACMVACAAGCALAGPLYVKCVIPCLAGCAVHSMICKAACL